MGHKIPFGHNDVDEINNLLIDWLPGQVKEFNGAEKQVIEKRHGISTAGYLIKYLNTIVTSGMPLSQLRLKISCPFMILCNLNSSDGVCNGTHAILT